MSHYRVSGSCLPGDPPGPAGGDQEQRPGEQHGAGEEAALAALLTKNYQDTFLDNENRSTLPGAPPFLRFEVVIGGGT